MFKFESIKLVYRITLEYPVRSLIAVIFLIVTGVMELLGFSALLPIINLAQANPDHEPSRLGQMVSSAFGFIGIPFELWTLLTILIVVMAMKGGFFFVAMLFVSFTVAEISMNMRKNLLNAVMSAQWLYYSMQPVGKVSNALSVEILFASRLYQGAFHLLAVIVHIAAYVAISLSVSPTLSMVGLGFSVVLIVVFAPLIKILRKASQDQADAFDELTKRVTDVMNGIKPLKAMGVIRRVMPMLHIEIQNLTSSIKRTAVGSLVFDAFREPLIVIFVAGSIMVAISFWGLRFEEVVVIALLFYRSINQVTQAQKVYHGVAFHEIYHRKHTAKVAEALLRREKNKGSIVPEFNNLIELRGISLVIGDQTILNQVSLDILARGMTALYGPSGSGKTTLTDVILGLVEPTSGGVFIDGMPLKKINLLKWRQLIGYVPQEVHLFHDTILANIALNDPEIGPPEVIEALQASGAWDFVQGLKDGVNTIVGERGTRFSGGERQRIAIARALVRKPKLLIMDEPTTALDPVTEGEICAKLKILAEKTAILVISHQTALAEISDVVFRIRAGGVEDAKYKNDASGGGGLSAETVS